MLCGYYQRATVRVRATNNRALHLNAPQTVQVGCGQPSAYCEGLTHSALCRSFRASTTALRSRTTVSFGSPSGITQPQPEQSRVLRVYGVCRRYLTGRPFEAESSNEILHDVTALAATARTSSSFGGTLPVRKTASRGQTRRRDSNPLSRPAAHVCVARTCRRREHQSRAGATRTHGYRHHTQHLRSLPRN